MALGPRGLQDLAGSRGKVEVVPCYDRRPLCALTPRVLPSTSCPVLLTHQAATMSADTFASGSTFPYAVGHRYIHAKSKAPLTLRYIGSLPPRSDDPQVWLGIEYDDPSHGKHSGTFKDVSVFHTRQPGAGAFVKYTPRSRPLIEGDTVVSAIEDRYGALIDRPDLAEDSPRQGQEEEEAVVLGSSNAAIVVEAPNMDSVRRRIRSLERLREVGLEGQSITSLGGDDERRSVLRERLKGELTN